MSKKKSIHLSIPQPCSEEWDKMSITEKGRYCNNCNKTVIDFSLYSDRELVQFFANLNAHVCGRFSPYQVNRQLEYTEPSRFSFFYKLFFGTTLATWFGLSPLNAATNKPLSRTAQKDAREKGSVAGTGGTKHTLYGVVKSKKDGKPLSTASVYIKELPTYAVIADAHGKFSIEIPDSLAGKKLTLVASMADFQDAEFIFIAQASNMYKEFKLAYSPPPPPLMGAPMRMPPDTNKKP